MRVERISLSLSFLHPSDALLSRYPFNIFRKAINRERKLATIKRLQQFDLNRLYFYYVMTLVEISNSIPIILLLYIRQNMEDGFTQLKKRHFNLRINCNTRLFSMTKF